MNTKDFIRLGVPLGEATRRATDFVSKFILGGGDKTRLDEEVKAIVANPSAFTADDLRGEFAKALLNAPPPPRAEPVKYRQWGEGLEHEAVMQMEKACLLPVSVAGALMPDAHVGYGLPIGGVLATENAVIPYAVGVDIACRMKMTVLDIPAARPGAEAGPAHARHRGGDALWHRRQLQAPPRSMRCWTRIGPSARSRNRTRTGPGRNSAPAAAAIISSSSACSPPTGRFMDLQPGTYVALLSPQRQPRHGRGGVRSLQQDRLQPVPGPAERTEAAGLAVAGFAGRPGILGGDGVDGPIRGGQPRAASTSTSPRTSARRCCSTWRTITTSPGRNGTSSTASSARSSCIAKARRRPAQGVLGIIPGSMASPGFVVSGKGNAESLNSASHGAGRVMSRNAANEDVQLEGRERVPARAGRDADLRRSGRSADGLQEHPRSHGRAEAIW